MPDRFELRSGEIRVVTYDIIASAPFRHDRLQSVEYLHRLASPMPRMIGGCAEDVIASFIGHGTATRWGTVFHLDELHLELAKPVQYRVPKILTKGGVGVNSISCPFLLDACHRLVYR